MRPRTCRPALLLVVCSPLLLGASPGRSAPPQDPETWRAAGAWLALLDSRDYAGSWAQAARVFQAALTVDAWRSQATRLWERSGEPVARELVDMEEVTDPPGLRAGEYVRLRFECQCTRGGPVRETVLMLNEGARGWRVASYAAET